MIETGFVLLWSGAIVDIPAGWVLCNGNNGSPDLRNRFIVGAGDTYDPDDSGGSVNHTHDGTTDGHTHTFPAGVVIASGANFDATSLPATDTFTTNSTENLPPYYALAYIYKT